ncbi:lanthionine synthetase LanC family protein [Spirosoma utsteinense]|uniref:Lantibiotic modifying enzyme n=1 Tax=Spirosoma utsteinense TaxID=2585773 RepID=A0ABR6W438_9BACT|nr:lanthionine synthetase LanC family protein [Spirosoma utsteinense]MBC3787140.1 lantibiotic modifying enzyme [Spirosoma utsteinense]MBC3791310.1 lantibiotic modifying enzyme [Spirosoma utsteinense]
METLTTPLPPTVAATANAFVDTAAQIGRLICRDAIWQGPRCNFLTSTNDPAFEYPKPYFKALEADFYAGSAGVAFFLAALYHATGDPFVRKTARGTFQNTLATARNILPTARLGFFSGWTGIAYAAIRGGHWLNDDALVDEGRRLLQAVTELDLEETGIDVIDGAAGAIPALVQLEREQSLPELRPCISRLADQLVSRAERSPEGYSWVTLPGSGYRNLTGMAHGVAGIVNALFEAFTLTGDSRCQEAAFQGLRYENAFFDQQQQNWPDFRVANPPHTQGEAPGPVCSCAWCHGAPGIALARLRGYELTQHPALRAEAETGLQTTAQQLTWEQQPNFSLCHGLAGNADTLLEAADILQIPDWRQQAEAVGQMGQARYEQTGLWANGLYNDYQIPDFMLGLSGTGYFYLRLANPAVYRSALLLR